MGGISFNATGMPSFVRPRSGDPSSRETAPTGPGAGTLGDVLARVQQLRGAVAEGAAAMQARQALGIPVPVPVSAAAAPAVVWGGGASIDDAIGGCACCVPTDVGAPRCFDELSSAQVFQAPAQFEASVQSDVPVQDGDDIAQDEVLPDPPFVESSGIAAPIPVNDVPAPVEDAPNLPAAPAADDGAAMPADAAPHDTTRREDEPNPVYYGDAPADIPLPPAPGATGTDARADPDPGAQLPPGEVDANATVAVPDDAAAPDAAPVEETPPAEPAPAPIRPLGELTPNQFTDGPSLSQAEGNAACGPAAAVAFARFVGQDVSLDHAANVAREVGWDTSGMKGPDTQVQLLEKLGIAAHKEDPVNWDKVRETVQSGTPVIIDTPGHYWVAEGYNPEDGRFNFAKSGAVYGDGGTTWYTPEEMTPNSGAPRSAIFLDR